MPIPGGYILQPRAVDASEIMHEPPVVREVWFFLLRRVNHTDSGRYKRGSGFFNLGDIQEALYWYVGYRKERYSKPQLTKSLRRLRERNMIATAKATRGVYITILNYDYYQEPKNYESNGEGNTKETRRKSLGRTKNKNDKECKNVINNISREVTETASQAIDHITDTMGNLAPKKTDSLIQSSADAMDKLIRLDGFSLEYIQAVLSWGFEDEFWQRQLLSLSSMRKKGKNDLTKFQNLANAYEQSQKKPARKKSFREEQNKAAVEGFLRRRECYAEE